MLQLTNNPEILGGTINTDRKTYPSKWADHSVEVHTELHSVTCEGSTRWVSFYCWLPEMQPSDDDIVSPLAVRNERYIIWSLVRRSGEWGVETNNGSRAVFDRSRSGLMRIDVGVTLSNDVFTIESVVNKTELPDLQAVVVFDSDTRSNIVEFFPHLPHEEGGVYKDNQNSFSGFCLCNLVASDVSTLGYGYMEFKPLEVSINENFIGHPDNLIDDDPNSYMVGVNEGDMIARNTPRLKISRFGVNTITNAYDSFKRRTLRTYVRTSDTIYLGSEMLSGVDATIFNVLGVGIVEFGVLYGGTSTPIDYLFTEKVQEMVQSLLIPKVPYTSSLRSGSKADIPWNTMAVSAPTNLEDGTPSHTITYESVYPNQETRIDVIGVTHFNSQATVNIQYRRYLRFNDYNNPTFSYFNTLSYTSDPNQAVVSNSGVGSSITGKYLKPIGESSINISLVWSCASATADTSVLVVDDFELIIHETPI